MSIETQIPIFRAKKIDSDEYITGNLGQYRSGEYYIAPNQSNVGISFFDENKESIKQNKIDSYSICLKLDKIDQSTLSIHFPDMIDSKGNKIFASLSEDGKGGDITEPASGSNCELYRNTAKYSSKGFGYCHSDLKIVGIQQ